ncbi:MAG TPA: GNAT family N-acetyltransferase [Sphingobium sp.]
MEPIWRAMEEADLRQVGALSDAIHGRYTEPVEVYAERLRLYPAGCFLFERDGAALGYLITHPWRRMQPPPLGGLLSAIPVEADSYYLHDLALLPDARGTGAGASGVALALDRARCAGFAETCLVAVGGADSFWASRGFEAVADAAIAAKLHASYGPDALYMCREDVN